MSLRSFTGALALLLLLLGSAPALAAISIEADQFEAQKEQELYRASGNVRLTDGPMVLHSNEMEWEAATGRARAQGDVWLDDPDFFLEGSSLDFQVTEKLGLVEDGRIYMRDPGYRIRGSRIEKLGVDEFLIENGSFTLCEGDVPDWKFGASRIEITKGGYARARNAVFYLSDIPVFYLPYIIYPVKTERESGFLMPSIGYSDEKGAQLSLVYFLDLGRNRDATIYLDHFTKMGLGKGLEYRYIEAMENEGVFEYYHLGGRKEVPDDYAWRLDHQGNLPGELRLIADLEYVSDKEYFEEFGNVAEQYNKEQVESTLALSRSWGNWSLSTEMIYLKDLEKDNEATLQRLPELSLNYRRTPLAGPWFAEMETESTYFWRRKGLKGGRLMTRPSLMASFYPTSFLEVAPELGYRQRWYRTSSDGPGSKQAGIYDFSTRVSTKLTRIFSPELGALEKIQHSIEPELTYFFTPDKDQADLPSFDSLDRIEAQNRIAYALVNRITARYAEPGQERRYHELLYLKVGGDFDLSVERDDELDHPFSEILTEMTFRPDGKSRFDFDLSYDPYSRLMTKLNLEAYVYPEDDLGLSLSYRYDREVQEYLEGRVSIPWLRPLFMNYSHRQDLLENERLEDVLELEWRDRCWSMFLTLSDRPEEQKLVLSFSLSELGEMMRLGGNLGSDLGGRGNFRNN